MADEAMVAPARAIRRRLGGGMRQAGVLAAAGLFALRHNIERLADDHARARRLADALADAAPDRVDPAAVETNIVPMTVDDAATFAADCRVAGVLVSAVGPRRIRLVTHLDVDDAGIDRAIDVVGRALSRST
jgi:threonine aldolase